MSKDGSPGTIDHEFNRRRYHPRRLGFMAGNPSVDVAYEAYRKSPNWQEAKGKYRAAGKPMYCFVCGSEPVELHSSSYARLGFENPDDLVALCRRHHTSVSTLIAVHRYSFHKAHLSERAAFGRTGCHPWNK